MGISTTREGFLTQRHGATEREIPATDGISDQPMNESHRLAMTPCSSHPPFKHRGGKKLGVWHTLLSKNGVWINVCGVKIFSLWHGKRCFSKIEGQNAGVRTRVAVNVYNGKGEFWQIRIYWKNRDTVSTSVNVYKGIVWVGKSRV